MEGSVALATATIILDDASRPKGHLDGIRSGDLVSPAVGREVAETS
jgi:hypothetical protein